MTRAIVYGLGLMLTIACKTRAGLDLEETETDMRRHDHDGREYRGAKMGQL
jgi:hypothetical protein